VGGRQAGIILGRKQPCPMYASDRVCASKAVAQSCACDSGCGSIVCVRLRLWLNRVRAIKAEVQSRVCISGCGPIGDDGHAH
jgi:hypothetical protein